MIEEIACGLFNKTYTFLMKEWKIKQDIQYMYVYHVYWMIS